MNLQNLKHILQSEPAFRLRQAEEMIYKKLISGWSEAKNFPAGLRAELDKECPLAINTDVQASRDQDSQKAVITLDDGLKIETVLMRHAGGRNTVCVSSQAGCPLACAFCATGQSGFRRNLSAPEIVEQAVFFARRLKTENQRISNAVFMGMGEPFLNYENVLSAIKILNNPAGLNIGARRISISTIGIVEGIRKLAREPMQINLAISLHMPNDKLRRQFIPSAKNYSLHRIIEAAGYYIEKTNRQLMFEYLLIDGSNDSPMQAGELADLLGGFDRRHYFINLISYNQTGVYRPSGDQTIKEFKRVLETRHINVTQRRRFGADIDAACGQLAQTQKK